MLSTASVPQLTGSPDTARKELPSKAPIQMLLTPGQTILAYPESLRYSVKYPKETWDQIWKLLRESDKEIHEIQVVGPGGIEFPQKAKGEAKAKV